MIIVILYTVKGNVRGGGGYIFVDFDHQSYSLENVHG